MLDETTLPLLQNNREVNEKWQNEPSKLFMAAEKGHADICTKLIKNNANVNENRGDGTTPLLIAAEIGYADVCIVLVENNAM